MITLLMLETPHVVVGAAIALKVVNPALAIPLAFGSHFVLERVPHWNPHLNTEKNKLGKVSWQSTKIVILDVILSIILGSVIASYAMPNTLHVTSVLLASFAAVLPDVIEGPYFFMDVKNKFIDRWIKYQKSIQVDTGVIPGLLTQAATVFAAFLWIMS